MENSIGNYIASGGVSGAIVCVCYFLYKCLYKKRIHSECCGNVMDIKDSHPSPTSEKNITLEV